MKKILSSAYICFFALALVVTACGSNTPPPNDGEQNDTEAVAGAIEEFESTDPADFLSGGGSDPDAVTGDLNLPRTGPNGTTITWEAVYADTGEDASAVIRPDGRVNRPSYSDGDQRIRLIGTVESGTQSETVEFIFTVSALPNEANAITGFGFPALGITANISGTNITTTVPYGTSVSSLAATFTTTGETVQVGSTLQTSGSTQNNFTNPVVYRVTAANGETQDYIVTVTVAQNSSKEITVFSFPSLSVTANISGTNITATVPYGTSVSSLVAAFTTSGENVRVGSTIQVSGASSNNFSSLVTYRVTATNGTTQDYRVTVTVAQNTAKAITAFSFPACGVSANISGTTITASLPYGTGVTALVASFTTTGETVRVGGSIQYSGSTVNNFTNPLTYRVSAADGSTQNYTVTVTASYPAEFSADPQDSDLVMIYGGSYSMGDSTGQSTQYSDVIHDVTITRDIYVSKYELTYSKWYSVIQSASGYNIGSGKEGSEGTWGAAPTGGSYQPVGTTAWRDAIAWCNAYSESKGLRPVYYTNSAFTSVYKNTDNAYNSTHTDWSANGFRLPTEAEWEYFAREKGDRAGHHYSGADMDTNTTDYPNLNEVGWFTDNSGTKSYGVAGKKANSIGLYDMSGNMWEWVYDWWSSDYTTSSPFTDNDSWGPATGVGKIVRGGSFASSAGWLHSSTRFGYGDLDRQPHFGFRIVRTLQ
ncbi:MAG: SUMF1/EgtB/PvdO family nonheme iron enzyme [bacterium]|nr:SUMF1/EgtB/PvdO family nonheme iron enzyme [bacterium]